MPSGTIAAMMKRPPIIHVENLRVERERTILRHVNWTMRRGENWVILGANGSGKTSLLKVLTGYLAETRGHITIANATRGADDWRELRKRVGLVTHALGRMIEPDEPAIAVVAGGREARLNLWKTPGGIQRRAALALMRRTQCARLAGQPWKTLSQGERQRVLIARALHSGLDVLILDEPCAGLDPVCREHFLNMLPRLASGTRAAVPLVLVTHHVEEIMPCFTHVLMLRKGRVLASGEIATTLTAQNLSTLFDAEITLGKKQGRFALDVRV
ncbi:MAG: ATP-binding cassette domain-containing protein [Puniceicoccales bacterium]|nr:ATP-binding cassette domain-containing protein [Puniceicoccales bacterium]